MSLRRTGLQRKTELKRGAALRRTPLARSKPMRAKQVKAARPKDTGPTQATRTLVLLRAGGCCELCGVRLHHDGDWIRSRSIHHRRPRRMGGSRLASTNSPANLLLVCGTGTTGCHQRVEANRATAHAHGWILHDRQDPAAVPVDIGPFHIAVFLTEDGTYQEVAA